MVFGPFPVLSERPVGFVVVLFPAFVSGPVLGRQCPFVGFWSRFGGLPGRAGRLGRLG